ERLATHPLEDRHGAPSYGRPSATGPGRGNRHGRDGFRGQNGGFPTLGTVSEPPRLGRTAVLVPVKAFADAKVRLAPALPPPEPRDDGTNVACVPASGRFGFADGPGSFHRHGAEARRLGLGLRVVRDSLRGRDVDVPDDLALVPSR